MPSPPGDEPPAGGETRNFATNVLLPDAARGRLLAFTGRIDDDDAPLSSPVVIQAYDVAADAWAPLRRVTNPALGFTGILHRTSAVRAEI